MMFPSFLATLPINHSCFLNLLSWFTSNQLFHLKSLKLNLPFLPKEYNTFFHLWVFRRVLNVPGGKRGENDLESKETSKKLSPMKVGIYWFSYWKLSSTRVWPKEKSQTYLASGWPHLRQFQNLTLSSSPSPVATLPNWRTIGLF